MNRNFQVSVSQPSWVFSSLSSCHCVSGLFFLYGNQTSRQNFRKNWALENFWISQKCFKYSPSPFLIPYVEIIYSIRGEFSFRFLLKANSNLFTEHLLCSRHYSGCILVNKRENILSLWSLLLSLLFLNTWHSCSYFLRLGLRLTFEANLLINQFRWISGAP